MTADNEREFSPPKAEWGPGPWQDEPDRKEWRHNGFPCLAVRSGHGNWCGYVGVPPGHPWHGKGYADVEGEAHGGLTYADACAGHICHVPKPGEPDDVWWLGFDCNHAWDIAPGLDARLRELGIRTQEQDLAILALEGDWRRTYKELAFVEAEVEDLAEQAGKAAQ